MTKILVIDDEPTLREEIVELLTFEDYEAVGAPDGRTGIDYALNNEMDLILCDLTMPGLDGYAVLAELRSQPKTASIPFIFMTARATQEDIRQGMALGANHYITKPFYHKDLLQAIETCLKSK
jgi:CheY-like chemotaxis protein